jgi:hypothetical protein
VTTHENEPGVGLVAAASEVDLREFGRRSERESADLGHGLTRARDERERGSGPGSSRTAEKEEARRRRALEPFARHAASRLGEAGPVADVSRPGSRNLDQEPVLCGRRRRSERLAGELGEIRTTRRGAHSLASTQMS